MSTPTKRNKQIIELPSAALPAPWEVPDAAAIQALVRGDATPEQQRRALDWIIQSACGTYEVDYRVDPREHAMVSGKRHVGLQIVKLTRINLAAVTGKVRED